MQSLPASLRVFADADAAPVWSARLNPKLYARLCTASDSCTPLVIRHLQHSILLNCLPDPRVCEAHVVVPTWLFASHASFSCNLDVSLLPLASWSPHSDSASQLFALAEKQIALPLSAITLQLMGTVVNGVLVSSSLINPFVSVSDAFCRQLIGQLVCEGFQVALWLAGVLHIFVITSCESGQQLPTSNLTFFTVPASVEVKAEHVETIQTATQQNRASLFDSSLRQVPGFEQEWTKLANLLSQLQFSLSENSVFLQQSIVRVAALCGDAGTGKTCFLREIEKCFVGHASLVSAAQLIKSLSSSDVTSSTFWSRLSLSFTPQSSPNSEAISPPDVSLLLIDEADELWNQTAWKHALEKLPAHVFILFACQTFPSASSHVLSHKRHLFLPNRSTAQHRAAVLSHLLRQLPVGSISTNGDVSVDDSIVSMADALSRLTPGFTARDLVRLCREAFSSAFLDQQMDTASDVSQHLVTLKHFRSALNVIRPGAQTDAEGATAINHDLVGLDDIKLQLQSSLSLWSSPSATRLGTSPASGLLLVGPSGSGKTSLLMWMTQNKQFNSVTLSGASVYSKYLGDSERSIRQTFARARLLAPCLLICDDVDILGAKRGNDDRVNDRVIATLLTEMDGVSSGSGVFFVGSTSRVHNVDAALMRPGRFETVIELPQPKNLAQLLHDAEPFWLDIIASMQTEADARGRMLTPNDVKRVRLHAALFAAQSSATSGLIQTITKQHAEMAFEEWKDDSLRIGFSFYDGTAPPLAPFQLKSADGSLVAAQDLQFSF